MRSEIALLLVLIASAATAADWPHWRGPKRDGISTESLPAASAPKGLWKANVGTGFSSFAVANGKAYTMGHADDENTVYCFGAEDGKKIWSYSFAADLGDKYYEGGTNSTPTVDGDRLFVLSRWGDVFCFDAAGGKLIWNKNVQQETDIRIPDWGFSGSPLVSGDMLLLNMGERGVALDKTSGKVLWQSANKDAGYSTPYPYESGGKKLAILGSGRAYNAVDIATGELAWSFDWRTSYGVNAADPIVHDGHAFISSGYEKGCAMLRLGSSPPTVVWQSKVMRTQMNPALLISGHIYGIDGNESKNAALKCIDWITGAQKWTFPESGCGSVTAAGDYLIVLSDKGELTIGKASPDGYQPTVRSKVLSGKCWTVPVLANGRLYCRNAAGDVVCLGW